MGRLSFVMAIVVAAAAARGGASRICAEAVVDSNIEWHSAERSLLASAVFAESALTCSFSEDAHAAVELASMDIPNLLSTLTSETLTLPTSILQPTPIIAKPIAVSGPANMTIVAVPLPPAVVGGALAAATILGRPLLSGRRRRRAARTFR
jgi:hypothetical protein